MLLSPSSILCYKRCPRKFYYRYIQRLPVRPTPEKIAGAIVHSILAKLYDHDFEIAELPALLKSLALKQWLSDWEKIAMLGLSPEKRAALFENILLLSYNWYSFIRKKLSSGFSLQELRPIEKEKKIVSKELGLVGILDLIENRKGEIRIMDYKTTATALHDCILQLSLYALLYLSSSSALPAKIGIYWLDSCEEFELPVTKELLNSALAELILVRAKTVYTQIANYPKAAGLHCKSCEFSALCLGKSSNFSAA